MQSVMKIRKERSMDSKDMAIATEDMKETINRSCKRTKYMNKTKNRRIEKKEKMDRRWISLYM